MKLLTFKSPQGLKMGVKTNRGILDVEKALKGDRGGPTSIKQWLIQGKVSRKAFMDFVQQKEENGEPELFLKEDGLELGPCIPDPGKIICVGLNYRKHAEESNMPVPENPVLFNKFNNTLACHGEAISMPADSTQVDYEAELAIVIGEKAKDVPRENALAYVAGYCNANDLSARDLQFRTNQ